MKLTKAQNKRFDEYFGLWTKTFNPNDWNIIKQHLADELATQKKEIDEKWQKWWEDIVHELGKTALNKKI